MEVHDGFIVGIYNYCDRWCERCALTTHCRLFADTAETEASLDPNLKAVVEAPPLPEDVPPPPPQWVQELLEEANDECSPATPREQWERIRPCVPAEHKAIVERAEEYTIRTYRWLRATEEESAARWGDAREVISWFHFPISTKTHRALTFGPDQNVEDPDFPSDSDGSAKVALLGIDRSHASWLELIERGVVTPHDADPFIADLVWLGEALERARPKARAFIRPGFDEPTALAQFLATGT